jgi:hypothetical protein
MGAKGRDRLRFSVAALFSVLALVVLQGVAIATGGVPVDPLSEVADELAPVPGEIEDAAPDLQEPEESDDDSSSDGSSASAWGQAVDVDVLGQDVLTISHSATSASESDGSSSDATVLAILGEEIFGAHAESNGSSNEAETGQLMESCEMSGGQICLGILYGYAYAAEDGDSSEASSDTSVADVCLGGTNAERRPTEECDGPVSAGVLESHSDSSANGDRAEASESSDGARLCLGGVNEEGVCDGVGVRVLHSESSAYAERDDSGSDGDSYVAGIEQGGSGTYLLTDEQHIDVPPDCPDAASVICIGLNLGDSQADADGAGNTTTIIHVDVLPGQYEEGPVGVGDVGEVGTEVTPPGGPDDEPDQPDDVLPEGPLHRDPLPEPAPGVLPFTGAALGLFILIALGAIGAGSTLFAFARRRSDSVV